MICIDVKASRSYQVLIGSGLLAQLGEQMRKRCKAQKVAIVSDSNVFPLYGEEVRKSLEKTGFKVISFVFPAGEESKTAETYLQLLNFLQMNHIPM